ncbi:unnamed protein product (macronuclear) [Paramecium tetraurelia]|uniref:Transmembrane protein n=1 Tax=Paramecium tetraurelia TaxID=5888 RepID=A0DRV9_PARTE|nr:uncharacterized protein GSPATT00039734001 [Paramecium tetraurelia]CAK85776.1 unnamed protein product [Paramecium tetraurelia]|eukprot:XP_001453173.1 hypothetical protein (macronuclear) [Paramecium tetraurelia strain d4-2]
MINIITCTNQHQYSFYSNSLFIFICIENQIYKQPNRFVNFTISIFYAISVLQLSNLAIESIALYYPILELFISICFYHSVFDLLIQIYSYAQYLLSVIKTHFDEGVKNIFLGSNKQLYLLRFFQQSYFQSVSIQQESEQYQQRHFLIKFNFQLMQNYLSKLFEFLDLYHLNSMFNYLLYSSFDGAIQKNEITGRLCMLQLFLIFSEFHQQLNKFFYSNHYITY